MFSATATSSTQVSLTWLPVGGASSYEVYRATTVNGLYTLAVSTSSTSATESPLLPNTTYLYKVHALGNGGSSAFSPIDAATTIVFTDSSLSGMPVKAVHLAEIRTAVNAMRIAAVLLPATFTDLAVPGTPIKMVHITELRTSLDEARSLIGLNAIAYTDSTLSAGVTPIKATHLQELRNGTQ